MRKKTGLDPAKAPFYAYVMAGPFRRIREAFADRRNWTARAELMLAKLGGRR
jgi:hypothetical protein